MPQFGSFLDLDLATRYGYDLVVGMLVIIGRIVTVKQFFVHNLAQEYHFMSSWHSYPSIFALGHKAIEQLFYGPVTVEEKIDGSQFSMGIFNGELKARSKGAQLHVDAPEGMFKKAVEAAAALDLHDGWTYRGEYLSKPKHNTIAYSRVPAHNIILFDINTDEEAYLTYNQKLAEADRLGLEIVPLLHWGVVIDINDLLKMLDVESVLGGSKIEGIVIKNYAHFGADKKVLMGKYVSEAFKEIHNKEWKQSNPGQGDIIQRLITELKTEARWQKAVQHLDEAGKLTWTPKDIGTLIAEAKADIRKECEEHIKFTLYQWAIDQILRGSTGGLPEWYKEQLLARQTFYTTHIGECNATK
jgi:hypothetical protein